MGAQKIRSVQFPFPYAQTCDILLLFHFVLVPFVTTQWVESEVWGGVFVFLQVFILWSLNFIAVEIENPFGNDANDLDGEKMQQEFNGQLLMLLSVGAQREPRLKTNVVRFIESGKMHGCLNASDCDIDQESMCQAWYNLEMRRSVKSLENAPLSSPMPKEPIAV